MLPLSKTMENSDLGEMPEEVAVVRACGVDGQTPESRIWEYAQALRAVNEWRRFIGTDVYRLYDIGGHGSRFVEMVGGGEIVDPEAPMPYTLQQYTTAGTELGSVVSCLSVLEHVDDLERFLYHLTCLTAPGGLLFLTFDCIGHNSGDHAHFHWDRKRIFGPALRGDLLRLLREFQCEPLGEVSTHYPANTLYDSYAVASLAVRKRS